MFSRVKRVANSFDEMILATNIMNTGVFVVNIRWNVVIFGNEKMIYCAVELVETDYHFINGQKPNRSERTEKSDSYNVMRK